ncbi:MAG: outer membrane lipoprotein carrier protein LolA [Thermodesulfobacteriota bacterium]
MKSMRRTPGIPSLPVLLALVFAAALIVPAGAGAEGPPAGGDALLKKVGERYAAARALSATFRQEIPLQNVGVVRKASGKVYFGRPLKMRWDYRAPEEQLFLADGEHFYFRPAGSPEVIRRKIDRDSLGGKIPLLLLFGNGAISDMFRVEEATALEGGKTTVLRLVPKGDGAPDVRRIDLVAGTKDAIVREIHLFDRLGGANHLYLTDIEIDPPLPSDHFRFRKPQGVNVVDG